MSHCTSIIWFRNDLRLKDNPALIAASEDSKVVPVFIFDEQYCDARKLGAASKVWLHHSLKSLNESLHGRLIVCIGNALDHLSQIVEHYQATSIHWNRCYDASSINRDKKIKEHFKEKNIMVQSHKSGLLWEPWTIVNQSGGPYKVFTPFYRKGCLASVKPEFPDLSTPNLQYAESSYEASCSVADLNLLDRHGWAGKLINDWQPGEEGAWQRLSAFIDSGLKGYYEGRNYPSKKNVSRLSPHIHWGEISIRSVWHAIEDLAHEDGYKKDVDHFLSELGWREFSHSLLYRHPEMDKKNIQSQFDSFHWSANEEALSAWKKGLTGIPIVDAGMRELWETGYMHNRLRMIVGSFLVKNLQIDWRKGEQWFWDCLLDADFANNTAGWQWIAGCGADAAPYYRIFNPILQGKKFDVDGAYTRRFVPELKNMPDAFLFNPWEAPLLVLQEAGIELGVHYPEPIVDLRESREKALTAYQKMKK